MPLRFNPETRVSRRVDLDVKTAILRLARGEDRPKFERLEPHYYHSFVRNTWTSMFKPSISPEQRQRHYNVLMDILEIYGSYPISEALRAVTSPDEFKQFVREASHMLERIKLEKRVIVPVMTMGMVPGALVCGYLRKRGMLLDVAFLGHVRASNLPYYRQEEVYATEQDITTLKRHSKEPILVIDDTIATSGTLKALAKFIGLVDSEIKGFSFLALRDVGNYGTTAVKVRIRNSGTS